MADLECRHLPRLQEIRHPEPGGSLQEGISKQFAVLVIIFLAVGARRGQPEAQIASEDDSLGLRVIIQHKYQKSIAKAVSSDER